MLDALLARKRGLESKRQEKLREAAAILSKGAPEQPLTAEETAQVTGLQKDAAKYREDLGAVVSQIEAMREEIGEDPRIDAALKGVEAEAEARVKGAGARPFKSAGEQFQAIHAAAKSKGAGADRRLFQVGAAVAGASEAVDSDGSFLVQQDFSTQFLNAMFEESVLWSEVPKIAPKGNSVKLPFVDETSRATGSRFGGVRVYRANEGDTVTRTKPKFGALTMELEKMMGLCAVTEELLEDAPALAQFIELAFTSEFAWTCDNEVFQGNGAGQMLGILNSAALVTVAKESGQVAATVVTENIDKMWSRMRARNRMRAKWYVNQDIEPQLFSLVRVVGTGGVPAYMPPGGISGAPYGQLLGRPVVPIEQAKTLGTVGDIVLADIAGGYIGIEKGGVRSAQSVHVYFETDQMAFRFTLRNNGQPAWRSALTPANGANTLSPFVALATRA